MNDPDKLPMNPLDVDEAINECLDLEAEGRPDELRELIRRVGAQDPSFESKLLKARALLGQLRGAPNAPDMAPMILTEVDYLRPFLSPRRRRQVSSTRVAIAAAAVITLSFMAFLQRTTPQSAGISNGLSSAGGTVNASAAGAGDSVRSLVSAVDEMRYSGIKPIAVPPGRPHRWNGPLWPGNETSLGMGDTSRYDSGSNWSTALTLGPARQEGQGLRFRLADMDSMADRHESAELLLGSGFRLLEQPPSGSIIPVIDPSSAVLNLQDDGVLHPSWDRWMRKSEKAPGAGVAK